MSDAVVGLTWDHPRGWAALEAARVHAERMGIDVRWEVQSLEGFESAPLADLAERYDLIVLDHPHLGDALAASCLRPMEDVVGAEMLADIEERAVGPSLSSYRLGGRTWALPLDAATQVSARRDDLVGADPRSWLDVVELSRESPVALSLSGPHAYLTFASICRSFDAPLAQGSAPHIVDPEGGAHAFEILRDLSRRAPVGSEAENPIALLERMTAGDDIAYCPLVYGYVGYADGSRERRVTFGPAPEGVPGVNGSTIGGTGIAVTARATVTEGLRRHLAWLLSDDAQSGHIPRHEGQPSMRAAWDDEAINAEVGDFYRRTRSSIDHAWVRPRFAGFTSLQSELSGILREGLTGSEHPAFVIDRLTAAQNAAVQRAHSPEKEGVVR